MRVPPLAPFARPARIAGAALALSWIATDAARPGIPATSELVAASDITAISALRTVEGGPNERLSTLLVADARSGSVWSFDSSSRPAGNSRGGRQGAATSSGCR